jgi:hypothetical protein
VSASGRMPYERWKARTAVEHGARQAVRAKAALQEGPLLAAFSGIRRMQPIVVTNAGYFSGWRCDDVPVVGTSELTSWLRGARVTYSDGYGRQIGVTQHIAGSAPTADEFLGLLTEPLSWRIQLRPATTHLVSPVGGLQLVIPA